MGRRLHRRDQGQRRHAVQQDHDGDTCELQSFTVKLKHVGKLPKAQMFHSWVVAKTSDMGGIDKDGITEGLDKDDLEPGDTRVIAHTKVAGGGESDSVTFATSKPKVGDAYSFFCSLPGHCAIMKGTVTIAQ